MSDGTCIEVRWLGNYHDAQVYCEGELIGSFPTKRTLKMGGTFTTSQGRSVFLRYCSALFTPGFEVRVDGEQAPSSAVQPKRTVRTAAVTLVVWGMFIVMIFMIRGGEEMVERSVDGVALICVGVWIGVSRSLLSTVSGFFLAMALIGASWLQQLPELLSLGGFIFPVIVLQLWLVTTLWKAIAAARTIVASPPNPLAAPLRWLAYLTSVAFCTSGLFIAVFMVSEVEGLSDVELGIYAVFTPLAFFAGHRLWRRAKVQVGHTT